MKNIKDINTLEDAIMILKELYIANMTQLEILEKKVDKKDKEAISRLEKRLEEQIDVIVFSEEIEAREKIRYMQSAIESTYNLDDKNTEELKSLYITTMLQRAITSGKLSHIEKGELEEENENYESENGTQGKKEIDPNKVLVFQKQLEESIEKLLESTQTDETKKNILKIAIENIYDIKETDTKAKIEGFSKQYLQRLSEKMNLIKGISKDERTILELIKETGAKIYDDKEEDDFEECNYGDLIKDRRIKPKVIFQNDKMIFKRMAQFNVGKSIRNKNANNIVSKIENENVNKYELITLSKRGEMVSLDFFGKDNLENQLHDKTDHLPAILAAIAKAKEENREHIGKITIIDDELGTAVVQYDDNLEEKVKELKEREEHKKEEQKPEPNNSDRQ